MDKMTPSDTISKINLMDLNLNDNSFQFDFSNRMNIYLINDLVRQFVQKYNRKIRCRKNKDCKLAEVKQIRIHDFRHSCASLLINSGATINVVAKYLGHTKIDETLNTYSHLFKNQLNEIINIIDKLN